MWRVAAACVELDAPPTLSDLRACGSSCGVTGSSLFHGDSHAEPCQTGTWCCVTGQGPKQRLHTTALRPMACGGRVPCRGRMKQGRDGVC